MSPLLKAKTRTVWQAARDLYEQALIASDAAMRERALTLRRYAEQRRAAGEPWWP